jgi:hypothetical protein
MKQTTIFDQTVADRIQALLARCDQLRRGTTITRPTQFNREGEQHARQVAQQENAMTDDDDREHEEQRDQEPQEARSEWSVEGLPWTDYRRGSTAGGHR